ncbi:MAG: hypothetical protein ACHQAX_09310 [Gammaproteobacteria bacterium]
MSINDFKKFSENIFWDFKRSDNVEYNFEIILSLTSLCSSDRQKSHLLFKPICIMIASILECTMYDFLTRVQGHTKEKIPLLDDESIKRIKDIDLPNPFSAYNELFRKHRLLGDNNQIYDDIDRMIETRNRVHIQNIKEQFPKDEGELWSLKLVLFFGDTLKSVYEYLSMQHSRPRENLKAENYLFPEPWKRLT